MRKFLTAIAFLLLLPAGVAMAMAAGDKKDDKKDGGKDKDKGHQPIVIIIWEPAWPIVFRDFPLQDVAENRLFLNEDIEN